MSVIAYSTAMLRLYIVEPQPLIAKTVCHVLSSYENVAIVGEGRTFDADEIRRTRPDVVLADWEGDAWQIEQTVRAWRRELADTGIRICILTKVASAAVMLRAISAGIDGYILKDVHPSDLLTYVKAVQHDGFYADHRLTAALLRTHFNENGSRLSGRELEIARLVAQGLTNREIAGRLYLSDKTVKNHIANIFSKLHLTARTQIAVYVIRNGIS